MPSSFPLNKPLPQTDPDMNSFLPALPFYQSLSASNRALLQQQIRLAECAPSEVIIRLGQGISGAYLVLEGRLRIYSVFPDGNEATLYTIEAGETCVLALNSLFNDLLYPAWVEAETRTRVAVVPGPLFRQLFAQEPSVQDLTVRALSTLVFRLMEELGQVHGLNTRQRLANLLLVRASAQGELRMTQQQLAQHLGTRREVVARFLLEFAEQGYLKTGRGQLTLLDNAALRKMATAQEASAAPGAEKPPEPPPEGAKPFLGRPGKRLER